MEPRFSNKNLRTSINEKFRKVYLLKLKEMMIKKDKIWSSAAALERRGASQKLLQKKLLFASTLTENPGETSNQEKWYTSYSKFSEINLIRVGLINPNFIRLMYKKILPNGKIVGRVENPNTLHHKTLKPLKGGLFCEAIFGPVKDFSCACGKVGKLTRSVAQKNKTINQTFGATQLKTAKHKKESLVNRRKYCPDCDVEYTWSVIRRYQLGYIGLGSPVTHVWYVKSNPSYISILLDMKKRQLEYINYGSEVLTLENSVKNGLGTDLPLTVSEIITTWKKTTERTKHIETLTSNSIKEKNGLFWSQKEKNDLFSGVSNQIDSFFCSILAAPQLLATLEEKKKMQQQNINLFNSLKRQQKIERWTRRINKWKVGEVVQKVDWLDYCSLANNMEKKSYKFEKFADQEKNHTFAAASAAAAALGDIFLDTDLPRIHLQLFWKFLAKKQKNILRKKKNLSNQLNHLLKQILVKRKIKFFEQYKLLKKNFSCAASRAGRCFASPHLNENDLQSNDTFPVKKIKLSRLRSSEDKSLKVNSFVKERFLEKIIRSRKIELAKKTEESDKKKCIKRIKVLEKIIVSKPFWSAASAAALEPSRASKKKKKPLSKKKKKALLKKKKKESAQLLEQNSILSKEIRFFNKNQLSRQTKKTKLLKQNAGYASSYAKPFEEEKGSLRKKKLLKLLIQHQFTPLEIKRKSKIETKFSILLQPKFLGTAKKNKLLTDYKIEKLKLLKPSKLLKLVEKNRVAKQFKKLNKSQRFANYFFKIKNKYLSKYLNPSCASSYTNRDKSVLSFLRKKELVLKKKKSDNPSCASSYAKQILKKMKFLDKKLAARIRKKLRGVFVLKPKKMVLNKKKLVLQVGYQKKILLNGKNFPFSLFNKPINFGRPKTSTKLGHLKKKLLNHNKLFLNLKKLVCSYPSKQKELKLIVKREKLLTQSWLLKQSNLSKQIKISKKFSLLKQLDHLAAQFTDNKLSPKIHEKSHYGEIESAEKQKFWSSASQKQMKFSQTDNSFKSKQIKFLAATSVAALERRCARVAAPQLLATLLLEKKELLMDHLVLKYNQILLKKNELWVSTSSVPEIKKQRIYSNVYPVYNVKSFLKNVSVPFYLLSQFSYFAELEQSQKETKIKEGIKNKSKNKQVKFRILSEKKIKRVAASAATSTATSAATNTATRIATSTSAAALVAHQKIIKILEKKSKKTLKNVYKTLITNLIKRKKWPASQLTNIFKKKQFLKKIKSTELIIKDKIKKIKSTELIIKNKIKKTKFFRNQILTKTYKMILNQIIFKKNLVFWELLKTMKRNHFFTKLLNIDQSKINCILDYHSTIARQDIHKHCSTNLLKYSALSLTQLFNLEFKNLKVLRKINSKISITKEFDFIKKDQSNFLVEKDFFLNCSTNSKSFNNQISQFNFLLPKMSLVVYSFLYYLFTSTQNTKLKGYFPQSLSFLSNTKSLKFKILKLNYLVSLWAKKTNVIKKLTKKFWLVCCPQEKILQFFLTSLIRKKTRDFCSFSGFVESQISQGESTERLFKQNIDQFLSKDQISKINFRNLKTNHLKKEKELTFKNKNFIQPKLTTKKTILYSLKKMIFLTFRNQTIINSKEIIKMSASCASSYATLNLTFQTFHLNKSKSIPQPLNTQGFKEKKQFFAFSSLINKFNKKRHQKKIINTIYTFSYRERWETDQHWTTFRLYSIPPINFLDTVNPFYEQTSSHLKKDWVLSSKLAFQPFITSHYFPIYQKIYRYISSWKKENLIKKEYSNTILNKFLTEEQNFQDNHRINVFSGPGLINNLLREFNFDELTKMDLQNRFILFVLNRKIITVKNNFSKCYDEDDEKLVFKELKEFYKKRELLIRRTKLVRQFYKNLSNPTLMMIHLLPVLPPDLRPIIKIGNQIAASDLNRLYQRVIYRNDRLKKFLIDSPTSSSYEIKYVQRLLQEAVDNLISNGKSGVTPEKDSRGRLLKSLSDTLKGKQGRFRQYLLGKRIDYSGRSVIVVAPTLKIHECGIPKEMAFELYLPFLLKNIQHQKLTRTVIGAKALIKKNPTLAWEVLKELMLTSPVLLNRAPTLHRLGIQAFQPKLVEGRAILLHPLVCSAFNADFDGDQMAVHIPITVEARAEAWKLMLSRNNLLAPSTGEPLAIPSQDMVLGCYYLTTNCSEKNLQYQKGSGSYFLTFLDVIKNYENKKLDLHAIIWLKWNDWIENGNDHEEPIEIRINSYGDFKEIYAKSQNHYDKKKSLISQYVSTTPGKVIFNQMIKKLLNLG